MFHSVIFHEKKKKNCSYLFFTLANRLELFIVSKKAWDTRATFGVDPELNSDRGATEKCTARRKII